MNESVSTEANRLGSDSTTLSQPEEPKDPKANLGVAGTKRKRVSPNQPWWKSWLTATTVTGLLSAIFPVTTLIANSIQKSKELEAAKQAQLQVVRDRYLSTMLQQPEHAEIVLRFISITTEDDRVRKWAEAEKTFVDKELELRRRHRELYRQAIDVVARLAQSEGLLDEDQRLREFWNLYKIDMLGFESPEVEALMVLIGEALKTCQNKECDRKILENLSYKLARQIKTELRQMDAEIRQIKPSVANPPQ